MGKSAFHRIHLEHAQWRVEHLEKLLEVHRALLVKDDKWKEKEADYMERLNIAHEQLAVAFSSGS